MFFDRKWPIVLLAGCAVSGSRPHGALGTALLPAGVFRLFLADLTTMADKISMRARVALLFLNRR